MSRSGKCVDWDDPNCIIQEVRRQYSFAEITDYEVGYEIGFNLPEEYVIIENAFNPNFIMGWYDGLGDKEKWPWRENG